MSCYFVITLPQHIVLAADNRRRIFCKQDFTLFEKPVLLDDARKIHRINNNLFITGTGLSSFFLYVRRQLESVFGKFPRDDKQPLDDFLDLVMPSEMIMETYLTAQKEAFELMEAVGGNSSSVQDMVSDLLLAALVAEDIPVIIRYREEEGFRAEVSVGPGTVLFPAFIDKLNVRQEMGEWLALIGERLVREKTDHIPERALELLTPVMSRIAGILPERVSASGDLIVMSPEGPRWALF